MDSANKEWEVLRAKHCDRHCRMPCSYVGMIPAGYLWANGKRTTEAIRCPQLKELKTRIDEQKENANEDTHNTAQC